MVSIPNIHSDFDIDPEDVCHTDLLSLDYHTFTANKHAGEQRDDEKWWRTDSSAI